MLWILQEATFREVRQFVTTQEVRDSAVGGQVERFLELQNERTWNELEKI